MLDQNLAEASNAARRFIAYRLRSEREVARRLSKKFEPATIEAAIAQMYRENFLDDMRFAQSFTDSRTGSRPKSAAKIRQELQSKGVSREIADIVTADLSDYESALAAARKKTRSICRNTESVFSKKLSNHLAQRGFNYDLSNRIVRMICRDVYHACER
ncbi:MAG: regulatory protein RecX [SAR202 cluster bacterium]|nr:regulatory protein RecX [SAR202 cluster bacterium]|tara:strand:- start:2014 stop:2490 length:477 start_codon:yes stop_codon:yes gene_type:complete